MRPAWFQFVATAGRWCWPDCQDSFGLGTAMSQIRTALVSLGNHALALVSQTGLSKEILAFPPVQFWITPSTEFTMGGFALFAILAFTGVANMNKRFRPLLTGVYVLAALPLFDRVLASRTAGASRRRDTEVIGESCQSDTASAARHSVATFGP
jgi:hypothetical protein